MSIGPVGIIASLAGGPVAQTKGSDIDRVQQEIAAQSREIKAADKAELAAGIGRPSGDAETSDRDADGRRLWEPGDEPDQRTVGEAARAAGDETPKTRDADNSCGAHMDLSG